MKKLFCYLSFLLLLLSCTQESGDYVVEETKDILDRITVSKVTRSSYDDGNNPAPGDALAIEGKDKFSDNDLLYISQLGSSTDPNFNTDATTNLYVYKYQENENANWEEEYNFVCDNSSEALSWPSINNFGSVGNSFSLYAMSFPGNEITFSIAKDQTGDDENPYDPVNFLKSDILGAYHATSALYTRLRFNLFHLMSYLKITLYVPVYKDDGHSSYSGYKDDAMQSGYILNAFEKFMIDWRANRSSDTEAPLTYGTGNSTSIKMYMHEPDYKEIELEDVTNYFGASTLETDIVKAYNFSVLFPARNSTDKTNVSLCFLLQNIDGQIKYYYFESNQITTGNYIPAQGTLQQLYLYLPRKNNTAILVGAKILPWGNSSTDMTVTEQKTDYINDEITGSESY